MTAVSPRIICQILSLDRLRRQETGFYILFLNVTDTATPRVVHILALPDGRDAKGLFDALSASLHSALPHGIETSFLQPGIVAQVRFAQRIELHRCDGLQEFDGGSLTELLGAYPEP